LAGLFNKKTSMKNSSISRRNFLDRAVKVGFAGAVAPAIITGCSRKSNNKIDLPEFPDQAPDGPVLKAGLIGCGGRGSGAAINFLDAGPNLQIVALGDIFQDRVDACRENILKQRNLEVPIENCFVGFDAYQKVIDAGVDIVLLCTPPYFRPEHLEAAIQAKKHVFAEKPACVDPVGARSIMASGQKAKGMGLCIVAGTQRRHQRDYVATWKQIAEGAIGDINGGNIWWNGGKVWHRDPNPDWGEMEYMLRDWNNWTWLAGDHIVEQHVHNIDVMNWFTGNHPVKAVGFGSRLRRHTGDMYDNFSVDYEFENGIHMHSMCRQIDGCVNNVSERIQGSSGATNCKNTIWDRDGNVVWEYKYPTDNEGKPGTNVSVPAMVQEHVNLVTAIRTDNPINEAENVATSSLIAIMGRISAYTGKETTYEEMLNSDLKLGPKVVDFDHVGYRKKVPLPGRAYIPEEKS
jgi:predicted dehydrogenase